MRKVLVTGGKGFLGSHIVSHLQRQGEDVRIFARPSQNGVEDQHVDAGIVWGDICDSAAVEQAVRGSDIVIHLVSNFRRGGSDKGQAHAINVGGTQNVLNACLKHGVDQLIHCSTIGVHGNVREIPATEETAYNPGDLYQETKLLAEQEVHAFSRKTGLPVTVIRPISLLGPGDLRMLKLFRMIKKGRFIMIGKGDAYFQPAYIDDVVCGFLMCIENPKAIGEVFIIGGDEYLPLRALVGMIADELGVMPSRFQIPLAPVLWMAAMCEQICVPLGVEPPLHRRRVSFFQNNRAFTIEKARRVLGYQPQVSLREGIRRTIEWYETQGFL